MARRKTKKTASTEPTTPALVAQPEEQLPCKQSVAGSNPVQGSDETGDEPIPATERNVESDVSNPEPEKVEAPMVEVLVRPESIKPSTGPLIYSTKVCAICGSPALINQKTCRYCGEGSWL